MPTSSSWLIPKGLDPEVQESREAARARWRDEGLYSKLTVFEEIEAAVKKRPDCTIHYTSREVERGSPSEMAVTLEELRRRSVAFAAGLVELGLKPGDVLGVQLPNWPEAMIAYYAASSLGLVLLTIVDIYAASELEYILNESRARALIVANSWRHLGFRERLGQLQSSSLEHLIVVGAQDAPDIVTWQSLETDTYQQDFHPWRPEPADPFLVLYTSGSTSHPKGVVHSHESLLAEVRLSPLAPASDGTLRSLLVSPPGHISGLLALLRSILFTCDSAVLDAWDPVLARRAVEDHRLTSGSGLFFLQALLEEFERGGGPIPPMDWVVGGSAVPPEVVEKADAAGWRVFRAYGSSEHPTVTGSVFTASLESRARTDGTPCPGSEIRILDGDDCDVKPGEDGEIVCRGPEQFLGYLAPELNVETFVAGGWLRTGDVGRIDPDGSLVVTGRTKDIIIRGGENISASEVEGLLRQHPQITDAAVVPYPDKRYGERVAAFIVIDGDETVDIAGIAQFFAEIGVAKQKTPEQLSVLVELPRTVAGKVDKRELRQRATDAAHAKTMGEQG